MIFRINCLFERKLFENEVGKETIDDVKSSSECGVKGLKDYLEETVEDETSNEAGEEISAKVSDSDAVIESDITKEDQKKESKGFISSIIGTVGGYFYGSNKKDEDSNEKISETEHIPREFQMQPTSETSTELTSKQPIDFKDESEIIVEESEEQTKGKESPEPPRRNRPALELVGPRQTVQRQVHQLARNAAGAHEDPVCVVRPHEPVVVVAELLVRRSPGHEGGVHVAPVRRDVQGLEQDAELGHAGVEDAQDAQQGGGG